MKGPLGHSKLFTVHSTNNEKSLKVLGRKRSHEQNHFQCPVEDGVVGKRVEAGSSFERPLL